MFRKVRLAIIGGTGGLLTWLVAEPFARTANTSGTRVDLTQFSLGSFYGWFAHLMLGFMIVGLLSLSISLERVKFVRAVLCGLAGGLVGGVLTCATDAASDAFWIVVLRRFPGHSDLHRFGILSWNIAVALAMAAAIAMFTQPTPARVKRCSFAGLGAGLVGYCARSFASLPAIMSLAMNQKYDRASLWRAFDLGRLGDFVVMGIILGLAIAIADSILATGRLRHVQGRNEGRTYTLGGGVNRIGSAEGIEVPLFGDPGISPVHAVIQAVDGNLIVSDCQSATGTTVNGVPISSAYLRAGDLISVGSQVLIVDGQPQSQSTIGFMQPAPTEVAARTAIQPMPVPTPSRRHILTDSFGRVTQLAAGDTTIGRDPSATISTPREASVSRMHACIVVSGDAAVLEDLNSRNGTLVNGEPVTEGRQLVSGDVIHFGREEMRYLSHP